MVGDSGNSGTHGLWAVVLHLVSKEKVMPKVVAGRYRDKKGVIRKQPKKKKK